MSTFKQLQVVQPPKPGQIISDNTAYWKDYEFPTIVTEYGAVNHISVSETKPNYVAVTDTSRVHIYDSVKNVSIKNFSFNENAYSANFRSDGKLMCVGFENKSVKIFPLFDENQTFQEYDEEVTGIAKPKKRPLRKFDDHSGPVHVCKFMRNLYHVMSASDDMHIRLFDLATSNTIMKLKAHKDYIRCGTTSQSSDDLILTGSYDHTIKLIDTRTKSIVLTADHGEPVENILLFPSTNQFLSCGGNSIKLWDVLQGGKLMKTMISHHKTVTSMTFNHNNKFLLSVGLDRHLKVYDLLNYDVVNTFDYPSSILSIGVLPNDKSIYVGMTDGLLSIKERKDHEKLELLRKQKNVEKYNPYKYSSPNLVNNSNDHVITHMTKQHLKPYDKHLKKFNATKALDSALDHKVRTKTPQITVGVMQELIRRGNIQAALAGKDEKSLSILIKFIQRNISNPNFTATLTDIANMLLDIYMNEIGKYAVIDDLFARLKQTIDVEIQYQMNLMQIIGTLDTIFVAQNNAK